MKFSKTEAMRFTGNLDLHRTLARTIRRAELPLAYSQGYNPRPKLQLATALPLGYTSDHEVADIWLSEDLPQDEVKAALASAAPPGILVIELEEIDAKIPKLQNSISSVTYLVTCLDPVENLEGKIAELNLTAEIIREKTRKGRTRTFDLKALIFNLHMIDADAQGRQCLEMTLSAGEGKTGRPDDVLDELGIDSLDTRIHKTNCTFSTT